MSEHQIPSSKGAEAANEQRSDQPGALDTLTLGAFDAVVGETFRVEYLPFETEETHVHPLNTGEVPPGEPPVIIELKLVEVTRYPRIKELEGGFDHRAREPFSLLLEGSGDDPLLLSAVHAVHHDHLGSGRLFLNPVQVTLKPPAGKASGARFYEVVFT